MKYAGLSALYSQLEATSKRLEKTLLISTFLKKTPVDELDKVVLLLQGRIFPAWDERKIGVAARMVLKAIGVASGITVEKIENEWKKIGDLGKVTEKLIGKKKQATLTMISLTVKKVFDNLQKLATLEGTGTVDKKVQLIAELLTSAHPDEAQYIIRTVLEDLRVGVADGTLRDAIVWAFFEKEINMQFDEKKKSLQPENREKYSEYVSLVQNAFNLTNDFALVAQTAKEKGVSGLEKIRIHIGTPLKVMLYQKSKGIEDAFSIVGKPAAVEYKYDGFRCITGHTPIYVYKKGLLSVKDIKKGDFVLSHKGNFKEVIAINKRKIDKKERLFLIQSFLGNEFRISEGHSILVKRNERLKWIRSEELTKTEKVAFPLPKFKIKYIPPKNNLILKDSSNYSKTIRMSLDFYRLVGYWIGDGFTNEHHHTERVGIVFNKKHKKRIEKYVNIVKNVLKIEKITQSRQRGMMSVYWRDKPLRIWLSTFFRREWKGKMLPDWFYNISKAQFSAFLEGWIDSDGHTDAIGRTSITTKERDLAMLAQLLGFKHKVMIALKKFRIKEKTYYKLIILKSEKHYKIEGDYVIVKLLKLYEIKRPDPRRSLYNLQVKDDKSYCTTLFALHNCQIHKSQGKITVFTRRLEEVTRQFPEVVGFVSTNVKGDSFVLDSEAVAYDVKTRKYQAFQNISQRIKRKYDIEKLAEKFPVELNVFDVISYDGKNLMDRPYKERRELMKKIVKEEPQKIVLARQIVTGSAEEAEKFYKKSLDAGQEGVMFKNLEGIYTPGARVGYGVKVKPIMETLDLVIVAAEWGTGKRSGWLSSFTIACQDDDTGEILEIGRVGTGFKELEGIGATFDEMTELLKPLIIEEKGRDIRVRPKIVIEVSYEEIQKSPTYSSGFALRFPRLVRLRTEEKKVDDISTVREVEDLYYAQRGGR